MLDRLTGKCGGGWNLGGRSGEVIHPDVSGTRKLFVHESLAVGCLG
jgi:hypothetical protein